MVRITRISLSVLGGVFLLSLLFVLPKTSLAADDICKADQKTCLDEVAGITKALGGSVTSLGNVDSGPCTSTAFSANIGQVCGMIATTSGSTSKGTAYQAGDTVKCTYVNAFSYYSFSGLGGEYCAVTSPGNPPHTNYSANGSLLQDSIQTGPNGELTGSSNNSFSQGAANFAADALSATLKSIAFFVLTLANFLLGIAGTLLNWVVVKTVFQFGSLIGNSPGLLVAWGILRDLGNMVLLFGFIFMGLATILDLQTFAVKKALPPLIIFAILMNFSLFAAEAVIDTSNALSTAMYSQANSDPCDGITDATLGGTNDSQRDCAVNFGIAGHIMQSTGLSSMFAVSNEGGLGPEAAALIGLSLFATIGAVVLFAAAIMLMFRVVTLSFLMVLAPIGFAGMAIPPLQKLAREWWSRLIHQAFFAPILFLFIFISLKISDSFAAADTRGSLAGAVTQPGASSVGVILIFALVIGFLVGSLIIAKSMGAAGAGAAIGLAKKTVFGAQGAAAGAFGRNTIGRGSNHVQKKYEAWMGKEGGNKFVRSAIRNTGIDNAVAGATKAGKEARFGSTRSFSEKQKHDKERKAEFGEANRKASLKSDIDGALAMDSGTAALAAARNDEVAAVLERMSTKELEELEVMKKSGTSLDTLVQNLSPEKFAALVKDGSTLSEQQKGNVREARFKDIRDQQSIITDPTKSPAEKGAAQIAIQDRLKKFSVKDLENSPSNLLADDFIAKSLNNKQREELLKNGKISPAAARKVRQFDPVQQINDAFATAGTPAAAAAAAAQIARLNPKQVARLDTSVLTTREFAMVADNKMLAAIQARDEIRSPEAALIKSMIIAHAPGSSAATYMKTPAGAAYW